MISFWCLILPLLLRAVAAGSCQAQYQCQATATLYQQCYSCNDYPLSDSCHRETCCDSRDSYNGFTLVHSDHAIEETDKVVTRTPEQFLNNMLSNITYCNSINAYSYKLFDSSGAEYTNSSRISIGEFTGILSLNVSQSAGVFFETISINIQVFDLRDNATYEWTSVTFNLRTTKDCQPTFADITSPQMASLSNTPSFTFAPMNAPLTSCSYIFSVMEDAATIHSGFNQTVTYNSTTQLYSITPVDLTLATTYTFYIKAEYLDNREESTLQLFSPLMTLEVDCDPTNITVQLGSSSFPVGTQYYSKNAVGDPTPVYFQFDFTTYTLNSSFTCPIESYKPWTGKTDSGAVPAQFVDQTATNLTTHMGFQILDPTYAQMIYFYVRLYASSTGFYQKHQHLVVIGCDSVTLSFAEGQEPVANQSGFVQDVGSNVKVDFLFDQPVWSEPNCTLQYLKQVIPGSDASLSTMLTFAFWNNKLGKRFFRPRDQKIPMTYQFSMKGMVYGGVMFEPDDVFTLTLTCGPLSTTVTPPAVKNITDGLSYYTVTLPDDTYVINTFNLSNPNCALSAILLEPISGGNNTDFLSDDGVTQITATNTSDNITINLPWFQATSQRLYKFRLKGEADGGAFAYTEDFLITVRDCNVSTVSLKDGWNLTTIDIETNSSKEAMNISVADLHEAVDSECPILNYTIWKVMSLGSQVDPSLYSELLDITSDGILSINNFSSPVQQYEIYISATSSPNSTVWSTPTDHVVYLNVSDPPPPPPPPPEPTNDTDPDPTNSTEPTVEDDPPQPTDQNDPVVEEPNQEEEDKIQNIVNFAPTFDWPPEEVSFEITPEEPGFEFTLPTFTDPEGEDVTITVNGLASFMTFQESSRTIAMPAAEVGTFAIEVILSDPKSNQEISTFNINILTAEVDQAEEEEEEEVVEEEQEEAANDQAVSAEVASPADLSFLNDLLSEFALKDKVETEVNEVITEEEEEEEEVRDPIEIILQKILPNGEMTLLFSEQLFDIEHYAKQGINMTFFNRIRSSVLEVRYTTHVADVKEEKMPRLESWNVTEFASHSIKIKLNFSNILYVSSAPIKDTINVQILQPQFFRATRDRMTVEEDYITNSLLLPAMARSKEEFQALETIGSQAQSSMLITLIVPFGFMVFMSVSMNRVWSLYLMLQIISNITNYPSLLIPANSQYIIFILQNISYFKILQEQNVQIWLKENVFGKMKILQQILIGQGPLILGIISVAVVLPLVYFLSKLATNSTIIAKLKRSLMWSSIFRGQIQFFFPTCLATFGYFKNIEDASSIPLSSFLFKLFIILSLPLFSYFFLKKHFKELADPEFSSMYGTLYQNLTLTKKSSYFLTSVFCLKRILIAMSTVYMTEHVIVSIYLYCFSSLFTNGFIMWARPMDSRLMNLMENLNEQAIYITCLFMFIFTDWIPEIETRYYLGYVYLPVIIIIIGINLVCIIYEIVSVTIKQYRRKQRVKKAKKFPDRFEVRGDQVIEREDFRALKGQKVKLQLQNSKFAEQIELEGDDLEGISQALANQQERLESVLQVNEFEAQIYQLNSDRLEYIGDFQKWFEVKLKLSKVIDEYNKAYEKRISDLKDIRAHSFEKIPAELPARERRLIEESMNNIFDSKLKKIESEKLRFNDVQELMIQPTDRAQ